MSVEDPFRLLGRLRLGREEYCQRLLTQLVLEAPYPRWNTRSQPSDRGLALLAELDRLSFGAASLGEGVTIIDEMDLPSVSEGEPGCAPDYGILTGDRLWIVELKTERGSHRRQQLPDYFRLAGHHYPDLRVDLTYLTGPMPDVVLDVPPPSQFAHVTWDDVMPLVRHTWSGAGEPWAGLVAALGEASDTLGTPWAEWRDHTSSDVQGLALRAARATAADGIQRAVDHDVHSLEELHRLRVEVRDLMDAEGIGAQPWVWRQGTSGGSPLTETGLLYGYELRLSRTRSR